MLCFVNIGSWHSMGLKNFRRKRGVGHVGLCYMHVSMSPVFWEVSPKVLPLV